MQPAALQRGGGGLYVGEVPQGQVRAWVRGDDREIALNQTPPGETVVVSGGFLVPCECL
jgi:hypothetical protein